MVVFAVVDRLVVLRVMEMEWEIHRYASHVAFVRQKQPAQIRHRSRYRLRLEHTPPGVKPLFDSLLIVPAGAGGRARAPGVSPQCVVHLLPQLLSGHLKERIKYLFVFIKRHALDAIYRRILIL